MTNSNQNSRLDYCRNGEVKLNAFGQTKTIGYIRDRVFYKTVFSHLHVMHCNNSLGFSYNLVADGLWDTAIITLDNRKFTVSRETVKSKGDVMAFPKSKSEAQFFINLSYLKPLIEPEFKTNLEELTLRGRPIIKPPQHRKALQTSLAF